MEEEIRKPGRPRKNPDEVLTNSDLPEQQLPPVESENQRLKEENQTLRDQVGLAFDRISRLESVSNRQRLRKYDELNDPESLKKLGRVPSFDGKDPIISMVRTGTSWIDDNHIVHDEQIVHTKTHSGAEKALDFLHLNSACSGNSIQCIVNDWDVYLGKIEKLAAKRHEFQRMTGRSPKHNTVEILKEIKEMEKGITLNVTLSEDYGKTFDGMTLDVPESVFNAF